TTTLTGFNLTIRSYAAEAGDSDLQESLMPITDDIYRTSGDRNITITLTSGRYYEFSIIPVFSNLTDRGIAVATSGARVLIVIPPSLPDLDGDGVADVDDVDDDGDGLIEIRTADEFNMIRNNLAGTNLTATVIADGNDSGCGNGADITGCTGYELMNNISLSSYPNWIPIGTDQNKYTAIFDGNNNTISDINITTATEDRVGLFASLGSTSEVRNLRLSQVAISVENNFVGALAGEAGAALINNIGVTNININGSSNVGGLLGGLNGGSIANSSVREGVVLATNSSAGGLVGSSQSGSIDSSFTRLQTIIATVDSAGGLIGSGSDQLTITSSYAQTGLVEAVVNAGGILGYAGFLGSVMLENSYAQIGTLRVYGNYSGSIIGRSNGTITVDITNSYGVMGMLENPAPESAGGLASSSMNLNIVNSYWDTNVTFTNSMITSDGRRTGNQTTAALQASAGDIYSNWDSSVWDFGEDTEYPALLNLIGSTPAEQRSFIIRR
ncbi:MAG: hypothetical protein K0U41_00915, partial [Gammaproteobacteria bacterium]|nr:hypothetical protein [Gammaproteobacteria bacterium]